MRQQLAPPSRHCRVAAQPIAPARLAPRRRTVSVSAAAEVSTAQDAQAWSGSDEFEGLGDRRDAPPLPLPPVTTRRRVVLVRHGQSSWNATGRIQGSSNFSQLTDKGAAQAETTRDMLSNDSFDVLFVSPLTRARQTADIVAAGRDLPTHTLPALREIDLYSFQGLLKDEGRERYGPAFKSWQKQADSFCIDGHAPVRELWFRASLAWHQMLLGSSDDAAGDAAGHGEGAAAAAQDAGRGTAASGTGSSAEAGTSSGTSTSTSTSASASGGGGDWRCALVVAHNAVNQALIGSALRLPPRFFRRLLQSNAATSVLDFQPGPTPDSPPRVTLDRLNQSPGRPYAPDTAGRPPCGRLVIVRHAATDGDSKGLLLGNRDEPLSGLGNVQAGKVAEFLLDMQVHTVITAPARRCLSTAQLIAQLQVEAARALAAGGASSSGSSSSSSSSSGRSSSAKPPRVLVLPELRNLDVGLWEGHSTRLVADRGGLPAVAAAAAAAAAGPVLPNAPLGDEAAAAAAADLGEDLGEFWFRTEAAWSRLQDAVGQQGQVRNVVVVAHAATAAALVSHCLGLGAEGLPLLRFDAAGVTIIDFPDGVRQGVGGVLRCLNYTAHLGRWAVPITRDDLDMVSGIDSCF